MNLARKLVIPGFMLLLSIAGTANASCCTFEEVVATNGAPVVDITTSDGAVIVKGADVSEVRITGKVTAVGRYARDPQRASRLVESVLRAPPVVETDGRIVIGELSKDTHKRRLRISYVVTVPRDAEVSVQSETGNVRVSGVNGEVRADSTEGEVTMAATAN